MIKSIATIHIPYWIRKAWDIHIYWRMNDVGSGKELKVTIWKMKQFKEWDDGDWYSNWWKHFVIWRFKPRKKCDYKQCSFPECHHVCGYKGEEDE